MGSGINRRCEFVGVSMAFLEDICHCGVGMTMFLFRIIRTMLLWDMEAWNTLSAA